MTDHNKVFLKVDSVQLVNKKSRAATLSFEVGESYTSSRSFDASITVSAEAGFWGFAKASASATAGLTIEKSTTMSKTYGSSATVAAHSTTTIDFGFRRYNQYIQYYHLVPKGKGCAIIVDKAGWVKAPYQKAFIVH